jgi:subtilisin family serine protease
MIVDTSLIENLIFKRYPEFPTNRFTQDSPVYPDVWLEYYQNRKNLEFFRADLILTPHRDSSAAELFRDLSQKIDKEQLLHAELATNGESVAAKLNFTEMLELVLPKTSWFQKYLLKDGEETPDLKWLKYIIGAIEYSSKNDRESVESLDQLIDKYYYYYYETHILLPERQPKLLTWSINRNRPAETSIYNSVPATKADSTRRLFDIDGSGITWAILDSGIDARHMAFRMRDKNNAFVEPAMGSKLDNNSNNSRIVASYDFSNFRKVISEIHLNRDINLKGSSENDVHLPEKELDQYIEDIKHTLDNGRLLDWSILAPLIRIPHNSQEYISPSNSHGTHVAGILGADFVDGSQKRISGMCPGIKLYDLRVFNKEGKGDEFNIMAAIQFVRWLNNQKDVQAIHGVNMSVSMVHDVASYACGQTPVCSACDKLVAEGTVVVAAAGNLGQTMYRDKSGNETQGFRMVNITDPGNAEKVITVGATHRDRPHSYGVSYFSSKGPTGDGRYKPDLVAPGEKIISTMIDEGLDRMDGTSMAAPHVSGAAALILAKHRELIGRPERIKEIICSTATDLGRERYFQGSGMLDVLRAIQSI